MNDIHQKEVFLASCESETLAKKQWIVHVLKGKETVIKMIINAAHSGLSTVDFVI